VNQQVYDDIFRSSSRVPFFLKKKQRR